MQLSNPERTSEVLPEQYAHIELSEEEQAEALREARSKKHYQLKEIEYKKSLSAERKPASFTAEQMYQYFQLQYTVDDSNRDIVGQLCLYFSGDQRFKGDLNKGLILFGGVGVGKTTMLRFFMRNQIFSFNVVSARRIEAAFSSDGESAIARYSTNVDISLNSNPYGQQIIGYCFDDIGTEANAKHFGKEKNVIAEILLNRYDHNLPKQSTHITTNLSVAELTESYGTRVTDRIKEMMNVIQFDKDAKSRRK